MPCSISLTGHQINNRLNLRGQEKRTTGVYREPIYITKVKRTIMDLYVIPLKTGKWDKVNQNMFKFSNLMKKLEKYYQNKPSDDLQMYIDLLNLISEMNGQYLGFKESEELQLNGVAKFEESLPAIRLAPAYELYNLIFGRPEDYTYDDFRIARINEMLKNEDITYDLIKENLEK